MHKNEVTWFLLNLSQLKEACSPFLRASYLDRGESHLGKALTKCSLYNKLPGFVVPKSDRALCVNNGNLLKAVNLFFSSSQARKIRQSTQCISSPEKNWCKNCKAATHFSMHQPHSLYAHQPQPLVLAPALKVSRPHIWRASYVAVVGNILVANMCVYRTFF